jgi:Lipoprotein LpqB beta-propeller domain/Sporulation and spore germination
MVAAGRRMRSRPALAVLAVLIVTVLSTAGCVSMPTGGPVQSFAVTQGPDAQSNPYVQIQPQPPGAGWSPKQIVQGFLTASASFGTYGQVALQYLTPQEQKLWSHPTWSAVVYKKGPDVANPVYPAVPKTAPTATTATTAKTATPATTAKPATTPPAPTTASVQVTGTIQATLKGNGSYSVPSASATSGSSDAPPPFQLVRGAGGQWRISSAPSEVLLTSDSFANDYQLRNLYFFDPTASFLVPDPIYVPLRAPGDLVNGLVQDLITAPNDWLSGGATRTAMPAGTKISDVTVDGVTAVVNLTGSIAKISNATTLNEVMQQVSSQLLWTLSGAGQGGSAGQGVQSVEVELNSKPWFPPGSQGNPVVQRQSTENPATGANLADYYYVDSAGYLATRQGTSGKAKRLEHIGAGYTQVAVSPDGRYLAALHGSTLYTGLFGGGLAKRGSGYEAMSWDRNDELWASLGAQVIMFRVTVTLRQPLGQLTPVPVDVVSSYGIKNLSVPFSALRVAPDGVRVALVFANGALTFGAISGQGGPNPQIQLSVVQFSPPSATEFTGLTWYGADNVITLAQPGPAATEYPVSGGTPAAIPVEPGMQTITASSGNPLVADLSDGHLVADASLTGAWMDLGAGSAPAYPG